MSAVLPPERDDDSEFITRGEMKRMLHILVPRIERVEKFCFEDETDAKGNITQPSLKTFVNVATRHIKTLCDYASIVRWALVGLTTLGSFAIVLHQLGLLPL